MSTRGRPSAYTPDIAKRICAELADGVSLRAVCKADDMPSEATVRAWALDDVEGFSAHYTRARELGYERLADDILEISDDGSNDTYVDQDGNPRTDQDVIARSRLRVDSRKWMLAKMLPKRYGDKLDLSHSGSIKHQLADLSDDDLAAIAAGSGG